MTKSKTYLFSEVDFDIQAVPARAEPRKLLMCTPEQFDIVDVKNVHMEGQAGNLDKQKATEQWWALKRHFEYGIKLGVLEGVLTIQGAPGCEDMVFCANQTFPWVTKDGSNIVVLSKMRHDSRRREVPYFREFFENIGYQCIELQRTAMFEGMGDLIYHTGKRLLYGGYGHRTVVEAYDELAEVLDCPIVALKLVDERFYHLDTCFVSLGTEAAMICKEAFTDQGIAALRRLYKRLYYIPVQEAVEHFALNAHTMFNLSTNTKMCVLNPGATYTREVLQKEGFHVFESDTSEFMKSGGSVFCMKMMLY